MQLVPVSDVREGQFVAREVRNGRGQILLSRGQRLTTSLIARLRKFRIESVYLRDGYSENEPELVKSELRQRCVEVLSGSFAQFQQEAHRKCLAIGSEAIQAAGDRLIEALLCNPNPLVTLLDVSTSSDRMFQHSVNAAILAITLGIDLRLPDGMLRDLASAMLFHDIGMSFLPEELTQKPGKFTPLEIQAMRHHVRLGVAHLIQANAVSRVAANIVLRHHEAIDGSGYPEGLGGDKLSLLIRIACVVEVYDSMTSPRPYAPAVMPAAALSYILTNTGTKFPREVVLALCRRVALYPTGTAVQMNTGECGIVARTSPEMPTRPTVLVHLDYRGRKLAAPVPVDLMQDRARIVLRSAPNFQQLFQMKNPLMPPSPIDPVYAGLG